MRAPAAIRTRPRFARSRSVRLSVQDSRLSRGKGGFDSRTERQTTPPLPMTSEGAARPDRVAAPQETVADCISHMAEELVSASSLRTPGFLGVSPLLDEPDISMAQAAFMPVGSPRRIASSRARKFGFCKRLLAAMTEGVDAA